MNFRSSERITFYLHDDKSNFVVSGRFSFQPDYDKPGRLRYPDNEGTIARSWREITAFHHDLPDPDRANSSYLKVCAEQGLSPETVNNITMKSRLYYGRRIPDARGEKPLAVIIVESIEPKRYTEDQLNKVFDRTVMSNLSYIAEELLEVYPDVAIAEEVGL